MTAEKENDTRGLIHIYCGDGKGKTTAAIGLSVRAGSGGYHVIFVQFLKSWPTAELETLRALDYVTVMRGTYPAKFSKDYTESERTAVIAENNRLFHDAVSAVNPAEKTLLVFDELLGTIDAGLLDEATVIEYIERKEDTIELVLTGRNPSRELLAKADYVSEIKMVKHPYTCGISARKGIEF